MQDRCFIFLVHRLTRIRLRASRYGVTRSSPYLGVGCATRGGFDLRLPTSGFLGCRAARVVSMRGSGGSLVADSAQAILMRIVSMRMGLIRSASSSRVHEDSVDYGIRRTESTDYD